MNEKAKNGASGSEPSFFLSEILGIPVRMGTRTIGKLDDLVIKEEETFPLVTQLVISRPFGEIAVVPWSAVAQMDPKQVVLSISDVASFMGHPEEHAVLLRDHVLDKKAIDMDGREMEVIYDVKLVLRNRTLYVSDVDLSRYGLLRRMGLAGLANWLYGLAVSVRDKTIPWSYIQPLPEDLGSFRGNLRFKVLREKLADIEPVDLADILEEMEPNQRVQIFDALDPEHASDTLEEIEPSVQRDLVESLRVDKVAQLVNQMTTGQAADVLSILSASEANGILKLLDPDNARKIRDIMDHHEERILDYATQEYIGFPLELTVERALDEYRNAAKGKDVVMYLYVIDPQGRLLGVIDIKELLQAEDRAALRDIMVDNYISLEPDSTLKEAYEMFARYDYRALPVTDKDRTMLGVVPYRDVMNLKHRFVE